MTFHTSIRCIISAVTSTAVFEGRHVDSATDEISITRRRRRSPRRRALFPPPPVVLLLVHALRHIDAGGEARPHAEIFSPVSAAEIPHGGKFPSGTGGQWLGHANGAPPPPPPPFTRDA
eukprot:CAMPEP_0113317518 /NCGR_PEP_ID=MMETSP0010_2-20120614/12392_1 /TAXON_ID=216773 ORGANISM="Corethron hystrix, Strain 308" /NCGR_SAMPLE_ID=MMETSP0010_2 /ASSEMBLY_ACC=CAM_ASM_000155 /LENGTH=118 /DNA_ID=CAMNT_0000174511 /DNA_START=21 /DNA_END=374 /DNA_ORIENTATION=+ /assembly_acc=CAM_ASM_000155